MRPTRLIALALLLLTLAACGTPSELARSPSILIDQPTAPFPYNSQICP